MAEINAIKSGQLDAKIQEELRGVLARKYGKKKLDSWVPPPEIVKEAVEAGPLKDGEQHPAAEKAIPEGSAASIAHAQEGDAGTGAKQDETLDEKPVLEDKADATPGVASAVSDLSPLPTTSQHVPPVNIEEATPVIPQSPTPEDAGTRASKRKATDQLVAPTSSKRAGRRVASPAQSPAEPVFENAEDGTVEDEERTGKADRRSSRRSAQRGMQSPRGSSRGASVVSTSSTPAAEEKRSTRRGGATAKGMRGEVMSKSIRAQSVAESVKEEAEEDDEGGEEAEEETPRSTGRPKRGKQDTTTEVKRPESKDATGKRSKRGSFRGKSTRKRDSCDG